MDFCTIRSCFFCLQANLLCPRYKVVLASIKHPIVDCVCGQSGSVEFDVRSPNSTTVECRNEHHRPRLASRRAGDGAHRELERGKLGPDRIGDVIVASAASHI